MLAVVELHRLAQQGATLLVPNLRVARQLRSQIAAEAAGQDQAAAISERVLHWRAWTAGLWQQALLQGRDERILLQPLQERLLWEQVLNRDDQIERTDALLDLCLSAATLLHQHNAVSALLADRSASPNGDVSRFGRWFRAFDRRCRDELLLPAAALESALADSFPPSNSPQTLILCNLAALSPAQASLLAALKTQGSTLIEAPHRAVATASPVLLRCRDDRDELQALTEHLAQALAAPERPSIAVVVPDLSSARDRIDRTLREHLHSSSGIALPDERRPLWEFSTGRPLAATGVIADALHLLTWTTRELEGGEISLLLRSPHLEWPVDADTAASLDAALLRRHPDLRGTWSPRSAASILHKPSPTLAAALLQRTKIWPGLHQGTGSFTGFAERARHILGDFGWFRSGQRTSSEFQAVTRFENLLDGLAALDLIPGEPLSWSDFIHRLTAAARATRFAPENTGAPIQFLTPDESTGVESGDLWVVHAGEDQWNSRATQHPLLPAHLQRRHGMPGTDPALDQSRFREQVERIARIAPTATFSYAHACEAGEQRPATAASSLPGLQFREADPAGTLERVHASADLQVFQDGALVPLTLGDDLSPISGGVSTLQSQAACAFRAFAERRLGSATLDTRDLGMDARDRGSLLHTALQIFWGETQDSKTLHRLIAEEKLTPAVQRAVDLALRTHRDPSDRWSEAYLQIQRIRLESLLDRWLRKEAERPPFRIASLEREMTVTVGGLPLTVRVDRIDEVTLPDGTRAHVIIDYKTGLPSANKWEGDRPEEPQLPLYATSAMPQLGNPGGEDNAPVGAIAFAVIRAGDKLEFVSAPRKSAWLSSEAKASTATLDAELESWRQTLQSLAEDFAAGTATVGPKEYPATCRFCDQRLLCRLNPALLDAEDPAEVDA
ncbi:PD-(D/E)XK nuclease family protein [Terriglobus sp.]|uniref:PD-(D/E)XK nuclease family protein n=1 Tax=Terriglobus sp. TaxID=1889013 RepID=UPI003B00DAD2